MKKYWFEILVVLSVLLISLAFLWGTARALPASCGYTSVCPTHGISASFSGETRMVERGCIYGKYTHGSCTHWSKCYCPGEWNAKNPS